jgi:hypothetical protein
VRARGPGLANLGSRRLLASKDKARPLKQVCVYIQPSNGAPSDGFSQNETSCLTPLVLWHSLPPPPNNYC